MGEKFGTLVGEEIRWTEKTAFVNRVFPVLACDLSKKVGSTGGNLGDIPSRCDPRPGVSKGMLLVTPVHFEFLLR